MASRVRSPRAPARTARWAEPGSRSAALFARAQGVLPGGNSRTTVYMAPYPPYAASGEGCWITDVEGEPKAKIRPLTYCPIADCYHKPYITTDADSSRKNNLENLPRG